MPSPFGFFNRKASRLPDQTPQVIEVPHGEEPPTAEELQAMAEYERIRAKYGPPRYHRIPDVPFRSGRVPDGVDGKFGPRTKFAQEMGRALMDSDPLPELQKLAKK